MLGHQAVCMDRMSLQARWIMYHEASLRAGDVMYMDHMVSQARYASFTMMVIWARRPDMQGRQAVCIVHMDHIGARARYDHVL
jgi:hypothetical protein